MFLLLEMEYCVCNKTREVTDMDECKVFVQMSTRWVGEVCEMNVRFLCERLRSFEKLEELFGLQENSFGSTL